MVDQVKLHPTLRTKLQTLLATMTTLGFPMVVTYTVRTVAEQQALYAQGRTKPGPIVTQRDGVTKLSNHQLQPDGFGHAVDCAFVKDGKPSWEEHFPWKAFGECAKALGLKWGGDWAGLVDRPHVEF